MLQLEFPMLRCMQNGEGSFRHLNRFMKPWYSYKDKLWIKVWFRGNCGEEGYKNPTQALLCPLRPLYFSMTPQVKCTGKAMCISHILIKMKFGKKPEVGRVNSSLWIIFLYSKEEKYAKSGRSTVFFINILPEFLNHLFRGNTTGPP